MYTCCYHGRGGNLLIAQLLPFFIVIPYITNGMSFIGIITFFLSQYGPSHCFFGPNSFAFCVTHLFFLCELRLKLRKLGVGLLSNWNRSYSFFW